MEDIGNLRMNPRRATSREPNAWSSRGSVIQKSRVYVHHNSFGIEVACLIRIGDAQDFPKLDWAWEGIHQRRNIRLTQQQAIDEIAAGKREFWVVELDRELVGELHVLWDSDDKDEANGENRAYLLAFRIHPAYQGKRLGSSLMKRVLQRVVEKGCTEVTIGVDVDEPRTIHMYRTWGFMGLLKTQSVDLHYLDDEGKPQICPPCYPYLMNL